jgi:hypothetical protein
VAQFYYTATSYVAQARLTLQDLVVPYRYPDADVVGALNIALAEMGRVRPDMFLDLKYQHPLTKGDLGDGVPGPYTTDDIVVNPDGSYATTEGTPVPVPVKYYQTLNWFIPGWLQMYDVADTQDARAQGFMAKLQQHLLQLNAA